MSNPEKEIKLTDIHLDETQVLSIYASLKMLRLVGTEKSQRFIDEIEIILNARLKEAKNQNE